ncbi:MAG TPA: protein-glutamate O-methyltransferase CheR [Telluria sp.]|nr:protein-glutamate O-methyltransferase CheR [Telluria sp.]
MNLGALLREASGLDLTEAMVERALKQRMRSLALTRHEDYEALLAGGELQQLIELVVVPESWMFRDPEAFGAAADFVRRRLAARPELRQRILSIPCAGGEEPYSMAMTLQDAGVARDACSIEALDLSALAVARARAGRYTRNAFRGQDLAFRERHFSAAGDDYQLSDAIRQRVGFSQGNLLAFDVSASAGRYDVIFCRNLLIYFDEPTAAAAIANLATLLADDGLLLAGYAEVPTFCRHGFVQLRAPGAFALQKQAAAQAAARPRAAAPARANPPRRPAAPAKAAAPALSAPPAPLARATPSAPGAPAGAPTARSAAPDGAALLAEARRQADAGELRAAAASCRGALAANPDTAEAYFILGMVNDCERDSGAAEDCWRRCIYLQPDHYEALCHLALLAQQAGDAAKASAFQQRAARVYRRSLADAGTGAAR